MAFPAVSVVPAITRAELDAANDALKPVVRAIRLDHRQWLERAFIGVLAPAEYITLSAIVSRTFGWSKALEIITLDQFANGHKHPGFPDQPLLAPDKTPVWCGTGQDRKTIGKALLGLHDRGMITRFRFSAGGRDAMAYMPLSVHTLLAILEHRDIELAGELPAVLATARRTDPDGDAVVGGWENAFTAYACGNPVTEDDWG